MLKEVAVSALLSLLAVSKSAQKCALEGEHLKMYVKCFINQISQFLNYVLCQNKRPSFQRHFLQILMEKFY